MEAKSRRKIEMGARALEFCHAYPDDSPGYAAIVALLEQNLARSTEAAELQRRGILAVRAATQLKRDLRARMRTAHLDHLASVGQVAAREVPGLERKFVLAPDTSSYLAFRTAAQGIAADAQGVKEVLVRHGLVESVLADLDQTLKQFDAAVEQGAEGRRLHVGASAELNALADGIVQVVKVMSGLNRLRFGAGSERFVAWESASSVVATPRSPVAAPPMGGEVKPAA